VPDGPHSPADRDRPDADATEPGEPAQPPVHERWWWTGTFRAVLGAVVIGYQWSVISTGQATTLTRVMVGLGAAVVLWGLWLLVTAWRDKDARQRPR
jgi:hypothetical protein